MAVGIYAKRSGAYVLTLDIYRKTAGSWISYPVYTKRAGAWVLINGTAPPAPSPPPPTLVASTSPTIVIGTSVGGGLTVSQVTTASASGGVPPYSYFWSYVSGAAMTIGSFYTPGCNFFAYLSPGQSIGAYFKCKVTDSVGAVAETTVYVQLASGYQALAASVSPSSLSANITGAGSIVVGNANVAVTGGTGAYNYSWARLSGDVLTIGASSSAITNFTTNLTNGQTTSSVYRCTVIDTGGQSTYADVTITLSSTYVAPFTANVSPVTSNAFTSVRSMSATSGFIGAYPTGGTGPYTYLWTSEEVIISNPSAASSKFTYTFDMVGDSVAILVTCTITDALGAVASASATINFHS